VSSAPHHRAAILANIRDVAANVLLLAAIDLSLRIAGFAWTLGAVRRTSQGSHEVRNIAITDAEAVARLVAMAGALYPGRARCLQRSLALHWRLRRYGVPNELRIGVQPYGFLAHAWVEVHGNPVGDRGEVTRKVVPFPSLPS
jgi:hypothetical protein